MNSSIYNNDIIIAVYRLIRKTSRQWWTILVNPIKNRHKPFKSTKKIFSIALSLSSDKKGLIVKDLAKMYSLKRKWIRIRVFVWPTISRLIWHQELTILKHIAPPTVHCNLSILLKWMFGFWKRSYSIDNICLLYFLYHIFSIFLTNSKISVLSLKLITWSPKITPSLIFGFVRKSLFKPLLGSYPEWPYSYGILTLQGPDKLYLLL